MLLLSRLTTANQPVGIESSSSPDLESDLPADDQTEVIQQPAQIDRQSASLIQPAGWIPESVHHPTALTTLALKIWGFSPQSPPGIYAIGEKKQTGPFQLESHSYTSCMHIRIGTITEVTVQPHNERYVHRADLSQPSTSFIARSLQSVHGLFGRCMDTVHGEELPGASIKLLQIRNPQ